MVKTPDLEKRRRELELLKTVNNSTALEADAIKQLLKMRLEQAKEKLVTATSEDMLKVQGEAQCLRKLYHDLTRSLHDQE